MFCHIEGVNFANTVYDTQDIATIRGSSLLLEKIPGVFSLAFAPYSPQQIEFGGAKAVFRFADGTNRDDVERTIHHVMSKSPWCHMSVVHGLGATPNAARAAARIMQYQTWSVPDPGLPAETPDVLDLTRPGQISIPNPGKESGHRLISESTYARRQNGTRNRPNFLQRDHFRPAFDFEEMLKDPGDVPEMVRNKLAVVAADGIGGGKLRNAFNDDIAFSQAMHDFRESLAEGLNDWAETPIAHLKAGMSKVPRFDTLLWGGDDMLFVMPAWLVMPFLSVFFEVTEAFGFSPEGESTQRLFHRVACIIADRKTPIRQMRALALDAEWELKNGIENLNADHSGEEPIKRGVFSIDVFESAALPYTGVRAYRHAQYGQNYRVGDDMFLSSDVPKVIAFCQSISQSNPTGFTRTLINGALQDMRHIGAVVSSPSGQKAVNDRLSDHLYRVKGETHPDVNSMICEFTDLPRSASMVLAQTAQLASFMTLKTGEMP